MNIFIDLFSGTGGAAQAFDASPSWRTIKIDNKEELLEHNRGLYLMDVSNTSEVIAMIEHQLDSMLIPINKVVIWASVPCDQFSWARQNGDNPRRMGQTLDDFDLTLLDSTRQIIEHFQPDYWIIENVHGAKPIFNEELDQPPTQEIGSIVLWGDFPLIPIHDRANFKHRKMDAKGTRELRSVWRARTPSQISFGLMAAIECQKTLKEWMRVAEIEEE